MNIPIIVLTPIKNESWILERFLTVTSQFADIIIIADQFSEDDSREIATKYPKVKLIKNENPEYDEGYRQRLLLDEARKIAPGKKILMTLDADEIMTADSLDSHAWSRIKELKEGTVLRFEKPDLLNPVSKCIRHSTFFTLGYVDDNAEHVGKKIHSQRVPQKDDSPTVNIDEIKFMHYALTRTFEYGARQRAYSVIENIKHIAPFYHRLIKYSPRISDYISRHVVSDTPVTWFQNWENIGIDMRSIQSSELNNFNSQVLDAFYKYGTRRFFLDDIWDINWEKYNKSYAKVNSPIPIKEPGMFWRILLSIVISGIKLAKRI